MELRLKYLATFALLLGAIALLSAPAVAYSQVSLLPDFCCCEQTAGDHTSSSHTSSCGCSPCTICNAKVFASLPLAAGDLAYNHVPGPEFPSFNAVAPLLVFAPPTPPPKILV